MREEIRAKTVPRLMKDIKLQILEAQWASRRVNTGKNTCRHSTVNLMTENKEESLKHLGRHAIFKGVIVRMTENMEIRRQWNNILRMLAEIKANLYFYTQWKMSLKNKEHKEVFRKTKTGRIHQQEAHTKWNTRRCSAGREKKMCPHLEVENARTEEDLVSIPGQGTKIP